MSDYERFKMGGIFHDLPAEIYHNKACPGISNSKMGYTNRGINHFIKLMREGVTETREMFIGSAVHDSILLPDLFEKKYLSIPKINRKTKVGKEHHDIIMSEMRESKMIGIEEEDYQNVLRIRDRALGHPVIQSLFSEGHPELSMFWIDPLTGLLCKGRADWLREDGIIIDIKTTDDARSSNFKKSIIYRYYDRAAAFYLDGAAILYQRPFETFIYIVIERDDPHEIGIYNLDEEAIKFGKELYQRDLKKFDCFNRMMESTGDNISYNDCLIESISTPVWARNMGAR